MSEPSDPGLADLRAALADAARIDDLAVRTLEVVSVIDEAATPLGIQRVVDALDAMSRLAAEIADGASRPESDELHEIARAAQRADKPRDSTEAEFLRSIGTPQRLIGPTR